MSPISLHYFGEDCFTQKMKYEVGHEELVYLDSQREEKIMGSGRNNDSIGVEMGK